MTVNEDTCKRPPEGWWTDSRGTLKFTMYGRVFQSAPEREGFEAYFVAVHGINFTTWSYRPVEEKSK